jgi:hypothetical protein
VIRLDPEDRLLMVIDDCGIPDGKPMNPKATVLMRVDYRGYPSPIHGDVALVNGADFDRSPL